MYLRLTNHDLWRQFIARWCAFLRIYFLCSRCRETCCKEKRHYYDLTTTNAKRHVENEFAFFFLFFLDLCISNFRLEKPNRLPTAAIKVTNSFVIKGAMPCFIFVNRADVFV